MRVRVDQAGQRVAPGQQLGVIDRLSREPSVHGPQVAPLALRQQHGGQPPAL